MNKTTFLDRSQPPEVEPTALERFRAANPRVAQTQDAALAEFHQKLAALSEGLNPLLHQFIAKAEAVRQIGIVLIEFSDTLAGKKLTPDFYQQTKHWFVDAQGRQVSFEMLEWFMATARKNPEPITTMSVAMKYVQPLLLTSGAPELQLQSEPLVKQRIPPADEFAVLTSWFEKADLEDTWKRFKANDRYWTAGHLRPEFRDILAEELKSKLAVLDEVRRELGI